MGKVIINETDHEKTVHAKVGDEIEITLANNEAVKHYWGIGAGEQKSEGTSSVLLFHQEAIVDIKEGRVGGFGGTTTFRWISRSPGEAIIELLLKASGEPEAAAHDRFKVTIIVPKQIVIGLDGHTIELDIPECCDGKKLTDSSAIITFKDNSSCKVFVGIRLYDIPKLGRYYNKDIAKLGEIIYQEFRVNPISENWSYFFKGEGIAGPKGDYWNRYDFNRDRLIGPEIDVWLTKLGDGAMCYVVVGFLKGKNDPKHVQIRDLIENVR